ncbi:MAG: hypothetical protein R3E13_00350 [Alphaproteobacteria bacterium]
MPKDEKFDRDTLLRELWSERVKAPQPVFDALLHNHQTQTLSALESAMSVSTNNLEFILSGMLATGTCNWYTKPANQTCQSIKKLSKGFALPSTGLAKFFDEIYVGKDIKDVLLNPDQAPQKYPNTISSSSGYFLNTISRYLPEDFWTKNQELKETKMGLAFVGDFAANEETMSGTTPLTSLFYAQRLSRVMPLVAEELRNKGHANLATIADCFAQKGEAMSKDIIMRASNAIANKQDINLQNISPKGHA